MKKKVSFLISGRGSNFTAVAKKIVDGSIPKAKLGVVISDKADAKGLDIAKDFGMDTFSVDAKKFSIREDFDKEVVNILKKSKTDLVVAAGFMRILTPYFVNAFRNKIINIHPALLPAFPGVSSQQQAFDYGVKITGCTTHFIDEGTDTGPIIIQAPVLIEQNDTISSLSAKILREEHRILPESVKLYCEGRLQVTGRHVLIK